MHSSLKISGFSMTETIFCMALFGIFIGLASPKIGNLMQYGNDKQAIVRAEFLNAAKQAYRMREIDAEQKFKNASESEERYQLLKNYLPLSEENLNTYTPEGYRIELVGDLDEKAKLIKSNEKIAY